MDELRQGVDLLGIDEDVHLHRVAQAIVQHLVVERAVPLGHRLQPVVEVEEDLGQGDLACDFHPTRGEVAEGGVYPAPLAAQLHHSPEVALGGHDRRLDVRLEHLLDRGRVRVEGRVVDEDLGAVVEHHPVADRRRGQDQREVVLPLEPLLDHVEVEEPEEAAAEAEAERRRAVLLVDQGGVVELQLLERLGQLAVVVRLHRVDRGEDHRLGLAVARHRLRRGPFGLREGVADGQAREGLDPGEHVAHLPRRQLGGRHPLEALAADLLDPVLRARVHQADAAAGAQGAVEEAHQQDGAAVGVVLGVEQERTQRLLGVARGGRQLGDDRLQQVVDAGAELRRDVDRLERVEGEVPVDLLHHPVDVGGREVDLVDHRHDREVELHGQVEVGDGLRLDPLGGVDDQEGALAAHQRAADLVGEVDVPGGVDQVQLVRPPVFRRVRHGDAVGLDGDPALALEVHRVEDLVAELPRLHRPAALDEAVGERRLAVVDVRDDAEVADVVHGPFKARSARAWARQSSPGRGETRPWRRLLPASSVEVVLDDDHGSCRCCACRAACRDA